MVIHDRTRLTGPTQFYINFYGPGFFINLGRIYFALLRAVRIRQSALISVFFSGGLAAAKVSFCLVCVQNQLYSFIKLRINSAEPVRYVFMYGAFAY